MVLLIGRFCCAINKAETWFSNLNRIQNTTWQVVIQNRGLVLLISSTINVYFKTCCQTNRVCHSEVYRIGASVLVARFLWKAHSGSHVVAPTRFHNKTPCGSLAVFSSRINSRTPWHVLFPIFKQISLFTWLSKHCAWKPGYVHTKNYFTTVSYEHIVHPSWLSEIPRTEMSHTRPPITEYQHLIYSVSRLRSVAGQSYVRSSQKLSCFQAYINISTSICRKHDQVCLCVTGSMGVMENWDTLTWLENLWDY